MAVLEVRDAGEAVRVLLYAEDGIPQSVTELELGDEFGVKVRLPDYASEVPAHQIDALYQQKRCVLQLVALIENGTTDLKSLSSDQLREYEYTVSVSDGSSVLEDNFAEIVEKLVTGAIDKMSAEQLVTIILGVALIAATTWGIRTFIQSRAEVRKDEIASGERQALVQALAPKDSSDVEALAKIRMKIGSSDLGAKALERADDIIDAQMRAAARGGQTEINGVSISSDEAKELRGKPRRSSESVVVSQEMRVAALDTSDPATTVITLEDPVSGEKMKGQFGDKMVQAHMGRTVHAALEKRGTAIFRMRMKMIEEERQIEEILGVTASPSE